MTAHLTLSIRLLALLVPLASQLHADAHLKMHWRRHHETVQEESGDPKAPGFLILTATRATAKLAVVPGQLSASILLPKRGNTVADAITPRIRLMSKNDVVTSTHFLVDLDPAAEKKIEEYLRTKSTGDELELGKRFEPVIEVRGFTVDKEPAVAAVIVPTILELEPNAKATDHDEDTFVFRGVYVPPVTRSFIGKPEYWKTILNDKGILEPLDPNNEACTISFDPKTDTVTFHILNRLKLTNRLRTLSSEDKGLPFILEQPAPNSKGVLEGVERMMTKSAAGRRDKTDAEISDTAIELLKNAFPNPIDKEKRPQVQVNRPAQLVYPRRNLRFSTLAPASNNEFPLYLAGTFTSSSNAAGKQKNIANFEVRLNISEKLVPLNGALNFGTRYSLAPVFYAKMNTTGIINDENSAIWQLPLAVDFFPGACCKTSPPDTFHLPPLRRVSLYMGYLGEASRKSDKRSNGGIVETRLFFAPMKSDSFSFKFQTNFGWEAGRYREKAMNEFTSGGPASVNRLPDGTAISESFTLTRSGTFSRLHGAVHSTFAFGPSSSLTVNYDMRRLLKAESYFDAESSAKGFFTPYTRTGFPSTFQGVDDTLAFLSLGRLEKGTRRYLDIAFNQEINKFFDVKVSYTRGELAPAFQFVNKFEVGIALKILGKDSATSR
jgi:hypothetical protein